MSALGDVMSRTNAHTPLWVRALRPEERNNFRDYHRCYGGVCDLDDSPFNGRCYRQYCGHKRVCGCDLCTAKHWHKADVRRGRTDWRRVRAILMGDPFADDVVRGR